MLHQIYEELFKDEGINAIDLIMQNYSKEFEKINMLQYKLVSGQLNTPVEMKIALDELSACLLILDPIYSYAWRMTASEKGRLIVHHRDMYLKNPETVHKTLASGKISEEIVKYSSTCSEAYAEAETAIMSRIVGFLGGYVSAIKICITSIQSNLKSNKTESQAYEYAKSKNLEVIVEKENEDDSI